MNKIYLVSTQSGSWDDFNYEVVSVYSTLEIAEKEKLKIEEKIQNIKTLYFLENESEYEKDLDFLNSDIDENFGKYDTAMHNVYNFQTKYPELKIHTVNIEERELL